MALWHSSITPGSMGRLAAVTKPAEGGFDPYSEAELLRLDLMIGRRIYERQTPRARRDDIERDECIAEYALPGREHWSAQNADGPTLGLRTEDEE